jgi:PKD repeat protein
MRVSSALAASLMIGLVFSGCLAGDDAGPKSTTDASSPAGTNSTAKATGGTSGTTGGANTPPVAAFTVLDNGTAIAEENGSLAAPAATNLTFDASGSEDAESVELTFEWDFGGEGAAEDAVATFAFETPGNYTVTLTVTDEEGAKGTANATLVVVAAETAAPAFYFFDDAEANAQKWVFTRQVILAPAGSTGAQQVAQNHPNSQGWHASAIAAHNGTKGWTSQTESIKGYRDNEYTHMVSPAFDLSKAKAPVLSFWIKGDAEANGFDGLFWAISKDDGKTWTAAGSQAKSAAQTLADWTLVTYKIPAASLTDKVKLRFLFQSDISCSGESDLPEGCGEHKTYSAFHVDDILVAEA